MKIKYTTLAIIGFMVVCAFCFAAYMNIVFRASHVQDRDAEPILDATFPPTAGRVPTHQSDDISLLEYLRREIYEASPPKYTHIKLDPSVESATWYSLSYIPYNISIDLPFPELDIATGYPRDGHTMKLPDANSIEVFTLDFKQAFIDSDNMKNIVTHLCDRILKQATSDPVSPLVITSSKSGVNRNGIGYVIIDAKGSPASSLSAVTLVTLLAPEAVVTMTVANIPNQSSVVESIVSSAHSPTKP